MNDRLLLITEAANGTCDRCGLRVVLVDPEKDRLVLVGAEVHEDEHGRFYVRCEGC